VCLSHTKLDGFWSEQADLEFKIFAKKKTGAGLRAKVNFRRMSAGSQKVQTLITSGKWQSGKNEQETEMESKLKLKIK